MTKPRRPARTITKLGHHMQQVALKVTTTPLPPQAQLVVTYLHEGQECRSVGDPMQGVPVPAGAKIIDWRLA